MMANCDYLPFQSGKHLIVDEDLASPPVFFPHSETGNAEG